jgi:hypothetical protein
VAFSNSGVGAGSGLPDFCRLIISESGIIRSKSGKNYNGSLVQLWAASNKQYGQEVEKLVYVRASRPLVAQEGMLG